MKKSKLCFLRTGNSWRKKKSDHLEKRLSSYNSSAEHEVIQWYPVLIDSWKNTLKLQYPGGNERDIWWIITSPSQAPKWRQYIVRSKRPTSMRKLTNSIFSVFERFTSVCVKAVIIVSLIARVKWSLNLFFSSSLNASSDIVANFVDPWFHLDCYFHGPCIQTHDYESSEVSNGNSKKICIFRIHTYDHWSSYIRDTKCTKAQSLRQSGLRRLFRASRIRNLWLYLRRCVEELGRKPGNSWHYLGCFRLLRRSVPRLFQWVKSSLEKRCWESVIAPKSTTVSPSLRLRAQPWVLPHLVLEQYLSFFFFGIVNDERLFLRATR